MAGGSNGICPAWRLNLAEIDVVAHSPRADLFAVSPTGHVIALIKGADRLSAVF